MCNSAIDSLNNLLRWKEKLKCKKKSSFTYRTVRPARFQPHTFPLRMKDVFMTEWKHCMNRLYRTNEPLTHSTLATVYATEVFKFIQSGIMSLGKTCFSKLILISLKKEPTSPSLKLYKMSIDGRPVTPSIHYRYHSCPHFLSIPLRKWLRRYGHANHLVAVANFGLKNVFIKLSISNILIQHSTI